MMIFPLLLLAAPIHAAVLTLQSPRVSVFGSDGSQLLSQPLSLSTPTDPVSLNAQDKLKITFQIVEKESGKGVHPHQTFLRFYDPHSGEEGIQPVRVTTSGKAKFEMLMAKPPSSLPPTSNDPLKVSLIIGSSEHSPLSVDLFDLTVPPSAPSTEHPDEASYHVLPEIKHTFRPDQKTPPAFISAVFTLLVLVPWVVLVGLWTMTSYQTPALLSPSIIPFITSIGAFEGLLLWYWFDLKLGQVLLYGAILGIATFFSGKTALASIASKRLAYES